MGVLLGPGGGADRAFVNFDGVIEPAGRQSTYTQAVTPVKREAQNAVVQLLLSGGQKSQR
jgi:hypothetical protein